MPIDSDPNIGIGTPIVVPATGVPYPILPGDQELSLTLDRYQELMNICCSAFNGLLRDDGVECCICNAIWTQSDRYAMTIAIGMAEEMREQELGYHLSPKYDTDDFPYSFPLIIDKKHLVTIGLQTITNISLGVSLLLSAGGVIIDPVVITVATTVTDPSEIIVTYHNSTIQIHPSSITISGGIATITIPRCRLVDPDVQSNCDPPLRYDDDDNFITEVDVKRLWYDTTQGAEYVWFGDQCGLPPPTLTEYTQAAYARIEDYRRSIVKMYPLNGVFTYCTQPNYIRVHYVSGRRNSVRTEMETARLAHTLLPTIIPERLDLCSGCWKGDQLVDEKFGPSPYGHLVGASAAWLSDSRAKVGQGGKFPSMRR
jgi:hypothetical protein